MKAKTNDLEVLLPNFINSLDNRSESFTIYNPLFIEKMLQWHQIIWSNWLKAQNSANHGKDWIRLYFIIDQGVTKVGKRSINAKQYAFAVTFFNYWKNYLEKNKELKIEKDGKTWYYKDYIFKIFFGLLIEFLTTSDFNERDQMWTDFPPDWKITKSNLRDKVFPKLFYQEFLNFALKTIKDTQQNKIEPLHEMIVNLFPEVDSKVWEMILLFIFLRLDSNAIVRSVIDHSWIGYPSLDYEIENFTFVEMVEQDISKKEAEEARIQKEKELEDKIKVRTQKAYELALMLFPNYFSIDLLSKYIEEAKTLKYAPQSDKEFKRIEFLTIFEGLKQCLIK